jgi:hypothetical protein
MINDALHWTQRLAGGYADLPSVPDGNRHLGCLWPSMPCRGSKKVGAHVPGQGSPGSQSGVRSCSATPQRRPSARSSRRRRRLTVE